MSHPALFARHSALATRPPPITDAVWPNMNCSRGLGKSDAYGCTLDTGRAGHYRPEEQTFLDPEDPDFDPKKAKDAHVFNFARDSAECCDPAGTFWTRMVQLDEPVRHQGRKRKIQHDRLVQLLVEQLAKNCRCKGLLWIGIGVHELKHGRPWYRDPAAIDPAEYGARSWVKESEGNCGYSKTRKFKGTGTQHATPRCLDLDSFLLRVQGHGG